MRYGSVCSGIEAATQAWHPLGWSAAFFSEIEKFPSAVLAHHYGSNMPGEDDAKNGIPNHGDMSKFERWPDHAIDILVGGTPCQSYSIAGLRKGLDDERGNLMLTYAEIARRYRPRWLAWENVPGVLSSDRGRDFASLLGLLTGKRVTVPKDGWSNAGYVTHGTHGYGVAWRVLDAQFVRVDGFGRAVPQRRRRVFVIGYLGDWRCAAAVLFERQSLSGGFKPCRKTQEEITDAIGASSGIGRFGSERGLNKNSGRVELDNREMFSQHVDGVASVKSHDFVKPYDKQALGVFGKGEVSSTLSARDYKDCADVVVFNSRQDPDVLVGVTNSLDASLPQAYCILGNAIGRKPKNGGNGLGWNHEVSGTLTKLDRHAVAYSNEESELHDDCWNWHVRRLTPNECHRLQGFPDNFCKIPWRGKSVDECPDGHQYKALGNSMAVNVMRWLGLRIEMVEALS